MEKVNHRVVDNVSQSLGESRSCSDGKDNAIDLAIKTIVATMIKGIVDDHAADINLMATILIPEINERFLEQRESYRCKIFRLYRDEHGS